MGAGEVERYATDRYKDSKAVELGRRDGLQRMRL